MNYKSFEDLPVWRASIEFALRVFEFTEKAERQLRGLGDTKNQLERAAISISNNIAEGFERGTNAELINFLYIARGSAGESRSMLCLCERLPRFAILKPDITNLKSRAKNVSSQLFGWIESLKNSDSKGEKYFTKNEKYKQNEREDWLEFKRELEETTRQNVERTRRIHEQSKIDKK
ncbi:MAG TPA: four helix bundle protein [Pyrinomonadaceae bacterium]|jgi:four helix bundle protein